MKAMAVSENTCTGRHLATRPAAVPGVTRWRAAVTSFTFEFASIARLPAAGGENPGLYLRGHAKRDELDYIHRFSCNGHE
ncbi:MAG TPA: hypothetical protein VGE08_10755 [Steroidobacter sp.]|uniref:hypothetical protein n=1 Tax=Steroidobacter sp. TaxID=1978227 RepID=UPI002EDAE25F